MRIRDLYIVFVLFMLFILGVFFGINKQSKYSYRDIVYYNDQLYRIEDEINNGKNPGDIEEEYGCVLVFSKELDDPVLSQLYRQNAFVLDLSRDGEYIGKVAWLDKHEEYDNLGKAFFRAAIIMWVLIFILVTVIMLAIYYFMIKPVRDLKSFAQEIAKGNLDTKIPITKNNPFISFTETFDLMREALKDSQKRQMESEIARRELVSSLSHDIKTPVAVIEATCEVMGIGQHRKLDAALNKENADSEIKEIKDTIEKIDSISAKAKTISSLMTDVMHSSLDASELIEVTPTEDDSTLLEDYFRSIKGYGNIIIKNNVSPCLIYIDRRRMEQVIDNVVGNSRKYAGTDIEVSFDEVNDMMMSDGRFGSFIRVTIRDFGPGVSEEDLPLIAQKYYRGSNASSQSGYGLGMYLVRLYMEKQGGGMEYYNENGFVVRLMLRKV
ncbi:MAG: HAMP domain-containing histidine kinase [Lachnospiraceae bacterium]|nr:HAMP domain-containing histidine kinase [Lachnospiraceae bacterium]